MKLDDIFEINQGHQITDEEIYNSFGKIPIYTGNNDIKGYWNKQIVKEEQLPCLTYPTKGFSGNLYIQEEIFDANNTAVLYFKEGKEKLVKLEYIKYFLKHAFLKVMTSKENISYLNKDIVKDIDIIIPNEEIQNRIININLKYEKITNIIEQNLKQIDNLFYKELIENYKVYQKKNEPIKKILDYISGNSGLTEEVIYKSIQKNGIKYNVLSSSTEDNTNMGMIPKIKIKGKDIKVFEDNEGLLITRNGKAGQTKYLCPGSYTINDHAYILYLREDCKYKINLKWLAIAYRKTFLEYSSNSDNGTWNMTGFFEHVCIDIPSIEEQNIIAKKYEELENIKNKLFKVQSDLNNIIDKEIIL